MKKLFLYLLLVCRMPSPCILQYHVPSLACLDPNIPRASKRINSHWVPHFSADVVLSHPKDKQTFSLFIHIMCFLAYDCRINCFKVSQSNNSDVHGFLWSSWPHHNFFKWDVFRSIPPLTHHEFGKSKSSYHFPNS